KLAFGITPPVSEACLHTSEADSVSVDGNHRVPPPELAIGGRKYFFQCGKKKQAGLTRQEISNSISFDALNMVENDDELGTNKGNSKLDEMEANSDVVSSAHRTSSEEFAFERHLEEIHVTLTKFGKKLNGRRLQLYTKMIMRWHTVRGDDVIISCDDVTMFKRLRQDLL
ncbi:hypothetical protein Tco_1270892, partial [Tanacetum coccineum]